MNLNKYWSGCGIVFSVLLAGCVSPSTEMGVADPKAQQEAAAIGAPPEGLARVIFKRHANMMGGAVKHFVIDTGEGNIRNAVVIEKKMFPPETGNFDKMGNVKQLYAKLDEKHGRLIVGRRMPGDVAVTRPTTKGEMAFLAVGAASALFLEAMQTAALRRDPYAVIINPAPKLPDSLLFFFQNIHDYFLNSQSLVPNAQLAAVGGIRSGGTLFYDRPPGIARISVITEGGDQAYSLPYKVEAGKTYMVDYYYMSAAFKISEVK